MAHLQVNESVKTIIPPRIDYWKLYREKYGRLGLLENSCCKESFSSQASTSMAVSSAKAKKLCNDQRKCKFLSEVTTEKDVSNKPLTRVVDNEEIVQRLPTTDSLDFEVKLRDQDFIDISASCRDDIAVSRSKSMLQLGQRSNSRPTRRCLSDLGSAAAVAARTPRTSALLSNPTFAKHLGRMLGVGDDTAQLWDVVNQKLGAVHDLRKVDIPQVDHTNSTPPVLAHDSLVNSSLDSSLSALLRKSSQSSRDVRNSFCIPSFREYKAMRKASRNVGGVDTDTIKEEDDSSADQCEQCSKLRRSSTQNDLHDFEATWCQCSDLSSRTVLQTSDSAMSCGDARETGGGTATSSQCIDGMSNCDIKLKEHKQQNVITCLSYVQKTSQMSSKQQHQQSRKGSRRRSREKKRESADSTGNGRLQRSPKASEEQAIVSAQNKCPPAAERRLDFVQAASNTHSGETSDLERQAESGTVLPDNCAHSQRVADALSNQVAVSRSVSDISDIQAEEQRKKPNRSKRVKIYKSDPFNSGTKTLSGGCVKVNNSDKSSELIQSPAVICSMQQTPPSAGPSDTSLSDGTALLSDRKQQQVKSGGEIKRSDSGVCSGNEEKMADIKDEDLLCIDCDREINLDESPEGATQHDRRICQKCANNRIERKEAIQEIVDTEISYGKDLRIIEGEFYTPMKTACLLNTEQLEMVFSNLEELIAVNDHFADILQDALESANEQGDEDYCRVPLGQLFHSAAPMLLAFESYCVQRAAAAPALEQLERDKDLLRIFLSVSQTENSLLRRMSCRAFLMVPVQRLMRYPLLLSRVYKTTPVQNEDREYIKKAEHRINEIITHINAKTKGTETLLRLSKRKFAFSASQDLPDKIEINKIAIEMLSWKRNEVKFVLTGQLWCCQPYEQVWAKKGRALKFQPIHCLLLTLGKGNSSSDPSNSGNSSQLIFTKPNGVRQAAVIFVREKSNKYVPMRDPIYLDKCVVSMDTEFGDSIEVLDIVTKESYLLKASDTVTTNSWHRHLQLETVGLGRWRQRRNALPNIMIQGLTKSQQVNANCQ